MATDSTLVSNFTSLSSVDSWALLRSFLLLNLSSLSIKHIYAYESGNFFLPCGQTHVWFGKKCIGFFGFYRKFSCIRRTYVSFHPPSVGLSSFCRKFSFIRRTYHFIHQVWSFLVFCRKFLYMRHTYHD